MHHHVHLKNQRTGTPHSSRQRAVLKSAFTREQLKSVVSMDMATNT